MKQAAGVLLFRRSSSDIEVLIAHPGGPFFTKKDNGVWSIIKGEREEGEDSQEAARREFQEETGQLLPNGALIDLGEAKATQKVNHIWALESDFDAVHILSNTALIEWPPRSGRQMMIPEIDRADWFSPLEARNKLRSAQVIFIDRLLEHLNLSPLPEPDAPPEQPSLF